MEYISAQQAAAKWGISKRRVQVLCGENRIPGAKRIGNMWAVPEDAQKPADGRAQTRRPAAPPTVRAARNALKKLTENAYREINGQLCAPRRSKMVFVSMLAAAVFRDLWNTMPDSDRDDAFPAVSAELLGSGTDAAAWSALGQRFSRLLPAMEQYICRYADYMDDILSWAYQYVNKLSLDSGLETTQFFTEEYMIGYLTADIDSAVLPASVYLDPACGGGNFLSHILNRLYALESPTANEPAACIDRCLDALRGYELDPDLAAVASVNLKLKALMLLSRSREICAADWTRFRPNIYTSVKPGGFGFLEADFASHEIRRVADGRRDVLLGLMNGVTAIYTNPPFQTVKGMAAPLKAHLREHFPDARCDLCNAFLLQCAAKIQAGGTLGLVTQSSWMYLDSFECLRRTLLNGCTFHALADLGSGAFYDLSGEKANVALVKLSKAPCTGGAVRVLTLRELPLTEKAAALEESPENGQRVEQTRLFGGERLAFSVNRTGLEDVWSRIPGKYGDLAVPMQGTSTGDAARFIGYYWEHLNDPEWRPVSKGGGYSRWCGLNSYVLKWGTDGEYIRNTAGSALRNTQYFHRTALVYSDTGTSGFNARLLEQGQVFVASGPGIRDVQGSPYAHLALLNSRIFSAFLRTLSPKLTVAAGYISRVPVPEGLLEQPELDRLGRECYARKQAFLQVRPNNLEWRAPVVEADSLDTYARTLFIREMRDEFEKLRCEKVLDDIILAAYALEPAAVEKLNDTVGVPAVSIAGRSDAERLDSGMAQVLDANCQLMRTRVNRQSLGCDGVLEFIARKEQVSPEKLAEQIADAPASFPECESRYRELVLHSVVLAALGFRREEPGEVGLEELKRRFTEQYPALCGEWEMVEAWIVSRFNAVHQQSFCGHPCYHYEDGTIKGTI